jgi:alkylhydroperoxidase family enzyme
MKRPTEPRIPPLDVASLAESQRGMPGISASNVMLTLARYPDLFTPWLTLAESLGLSDQIAPRERELAILRLALKTECEYIWANHVLVAVGVGVSVAEIEALTKQSGSWSASDAAILRAVEELCSDDCISDETFAALSASRDDKQMIGILALISYYRMNAGLLNSLGVQAEPGRPRLREVPPPSVAPSRAPRQPASATGDVGGTWHVIFHHPTGDQHLTLVLDIQDGTVAGSVTNPALSTVVPIVAGTVNGNHFSFRAPLHMPVEIDIVYEGTVEGDSIQGDIVIRGAGTFPFDGARA